MRGGGGEKWGIRISKVVQHPASSTVVHFRSHQFSVELHGNWITVWSKNRIPAFYPDIIFSEPTYLRDVYSEVKYSIVLEIWRVEIDKIAYGIVQISPHCISFTRINHIDFDRFFRW